MSRGRHSKPNPAANTVKSVAAPVAITGGLILATHTTGPQPTLVAEAIAHLPTGHQSAATPLPRAYTVHTGDTLAEIASVQCGNVNDWPSIYNASKRTIGPNPNLIYTGEKLTLTCKESRVPVGVRRDSGTASTSVGSPADSVQGQQIVAGNSYQNYITIAKYLMQHGYSRIAAAGVVGCIAGESAGNPESVGDGGGGLIGWTPLPWGLVTGNPSEDLKMQLLRILMYNDGYARYIPLLNGASSAVMAADIYSSYFERPAVTYSDVRGDIADWVYNNI